MLVKSTKVFLILALMLSASANSAEKGKNFYLVQATGGKGFNTPEEAVKMLEGAIIPGLDWLQKLQNDGKILAGGVLAGERALTFIMQATSNEELGRILRSNPLWFLLEWKTTPLNGFGYRANMERDSVKELKNKLKDMK